MHVGFEAKRFFTNFTGLGNYCRFVVNALSERYPEDSFTLFSPQVRAHPEYDQVLSRSNVKAFGPDGISKMVSGLWRSYGVSKSAEVMSINVYHGLSQELPFALPSHIKKVVTIHDLIFLRFPRYYNPIDVAIYKAKARSACKRADTIVAISQQTADDIVHFLNIEREKIKVVYQGSHPIFRLSTSSEKRRFVKQKYNLPDRYILSVGTIEERKNVKLLIEAMALLRPEFQLPVVVVGKATKYTEKIMQSANELGIANKVTLIHNVSFVDLPAIYQMAEVFVYPSLFEGFGIPLVEAIQSRVPVISSMGSCFSEAAGPHSLYVDPGKKEALAGALERVLSDHDLRRSMVEESSKFITRFSPEEIAADLRSVYSGLIG